MTREHQTKQNIRAAARRLFATRGFNAVSMRDIAQAVGKQPGGLYNHFSSKQALLVDLMLNNLSRARELVIDPLDPAAPPDHRLEAFVRAHIRHNTENTDDIFIAYMELRSLDPEAGQSVLAQRDAYEAALRSILSEGRATGLFTILDPVIHARSLLAMLSGVTVWYRSGGAQSLSDVTESYVQAALQSVGAAYSPHPS